jgi:spore coat polysaccharide biosynthesis protein SpsF (cytidylyltransferase family)
MTRTVGLIVARGGSTRTPGKALLPLEGKPMLWHMIQIAREIRGLDALCLATTTLPADDALADVARAEGIPVHRGDPERVLDRIHPAALAERADAIVYIGGDCPLLDPDVVSRGIEVFHATGCDYLSNYSPPTYPGGLDVNVISMRALSDAFRNAVAPSQRIHAVSYLTFHPEQFTIGNIEHDRDLSTAHWSLDYPEDIEFIRAVYAQLYKPGRAIRMNEVLRLLEADEQVASIQRRLVKPKVSHAFFSSPGMMKDITSDIEALCALAKDAIGRGALAEAQRLFREVYCIARVLSEA